jgi:hypothetical protein
MAREDKQTRVPLATILVIFLLIIIFVWIIKGGSFRLYASMFFALYAITKTSWLSIILVSVVQNLAFLPLRIIGERFHPDLKKFEAEIKKTKEEEQYFLLSKKVREGNISVLFYILNFIFLLIAFLSAGRVFLLEFYRTPISQDYLYNFIPYPQYPLGGIIFHFPFVRILKTTAVDWKYIIYFWGGIAVLGAGLKLVWRFVRPVLTGNKTLLKYRIGYNRLMVLVGGFGGTLMVLSTIFLRQIPTTVEWYLLTADLSRQNTAFNIVTACATFLVTVYSGFKHSREENTEARKAGIPERIIARVSRAYIRNSIRNGLYLAVFALWVTRLMPSSHDLSVLAFEACYILSPVTFDLVVAKAKAKTSNESQG